MSAPQYPPTEPRYRHADRLVFTRGGVNREVVVVDALPAGRGWLYLVRDVFGDRFDASEPELRRVVHAAQPGFELLTCVTARCSRCGGQFPTTDEERDEHTGHFSTVEDCQQVLTEFRWHVDGGGTWCASCARPPFPPLYADGTAVWLWILGHPVPGTVAGTARQDLEDMRQWLYQVDTEAGPRAVLERDIVEAPGVTQ